MNETQYKPGDLVKYMDDGDKGIVVKASTTWVKIYWFQEGEVIEHLFTRSIVQLLSRGHNNE
tara:strand:- start:87 stop:272 length:186 start_codon:yes stop_codon:yes gene_type:complete